MKVIMRIAKIGVVLIVFLCSMGLIAGERSKHQTHTVTIEGMKFQPEALTVALGDTVVWINKDLVAHTATSQTDAFDSKMISPDKSWRLTVRKPGEIAYICTYHQTMKATLRVE